MDICATFGKTLHPFPGHTPPTAILFSAVEETKVLLGIILLAFGLNFICSSWPIGTPLTLIFSNTIHLLFLCGAKVQEVH